MRRTAALAALGTLTALGAVSATSASSAATTCAPPDAPMTFQAPTYVDTTRAGGEPSIFTHPDGTLLYGAHAGTTHFYSPAGADPTTTAFGQNYRGQTYYWWSDTDGGEWTFSDRTAPPNNQAGSGFSDPDFAIDTAGNVYVSEINLANVAVSKSTDVGRSYKLANFFAMTVTDRQWKEADEENVVYMVGNAFAGGTFPTNPVGNNGHYLYKSTDGGATWSRGIADGQGLGDIKVDKRNGTLYEAYYSGNMLSVAAYRGARSQDFNSPVEPEVNTVYEGASMLGHWPSIDVDRDGNLYIVWDHRGDDDLPAGVYYSYSTTAGRTWAKPTRVDSDPNTDIWPWLRVGDPGKVAIGWFGADVELPEHNAETTGTHGWRVIAAQTLNGLGCAESPQPGFQTAVATEEPVHSGTVCQGGTACQAFLIDRRLGDYMTVDIDGKGHLVAAYSDTRQGGSVALPGFVRQAGGPLFVGGAAAAPPKPGPAPAPKPAPKPDRLPTTGIGFGLPVLAMAIVLTMQWRRRRRAA